VVVGGKKPHPCREEIMIKLAWVGIVTAILVIVSVPLWHSSPLNRNAFVCFLEQGRLTVKCGMAPSMSINDVGFDGTSLAQLNVYELMPCYDPHTGIKKAICRKRLPRKLGAAVFYLTSNPFAATA
jgi:hypothetical protein